MTRSLIILFHSLLTCCIMLNRAWTEDAASIIIYEIPSIPDKIDMDGKLMERPWSDACIIKEFYLPESGSTARVEARILALFDGENLVFGFDLPATPTGTEPKPCYLSYEYDLRRIPNVTITLDPEHKHGVYYKFVFDPEGLRQDLRVDDESWFTEWTVEKEQDDGRLTAEVSIPVDKLSGQQLAGKETGILVGAS
jgi:hypothetical protein